MIHPFQTNITFIAWFFGLKDADMPFELISNGVKTALPRTLAAYEYALLKTYPSDYEDLASKRESNHTALRSDDHEYGRDSIPSTQGGDFVQQVKALSSSDTATIRIQLQGIHIPPVHIILHFKFLAAWMYYAAALARNKSDASKLLNVPLFIAWVLYRIFDSIQLIGTIILSPVGFALKLTLTSTVAAARLAGTYVHYGLAKAVNWVARIIRNEDFSPKIADDIRQWATKASEHNPDLIPLPDLPKAENNFIERCHVGWKNSIACFNPVTDKIHPILYPLLQKSQTSPSWMLGTIFTLLTMLATVAFLDYVVAQVLIQGIENRPFNTDFLDKIGGGYAEIVWQALTVGWEKVAMGATIAWENVAAGATLSANALAHALAPSWDKIQIGMEFLAYFMVKNAVVAAGIAGFVITMGTILYRASKGNGVDDTPIYISGPAKNWTPSIPSDEKPTSQSSNVLSFSSLCKWITSCLGNTQQQQQQDQIRNHT